MRIEEILDLFRKYFPHATVRRTVHKKCGRVRLISIEALVKNYIVIIREVWEGDELLRYGYQLLKNNSSILRYDNAPHHPEVESFPHHKHRGGLVEPLGNPGLENFLEEAKHIVEQEA